LLLPRKSFLPRSFFDRNNLGLPKPLNLQKSHQHRFPQGFFQAELTFLTRSWPRLAQTGLESFFALASAIQKEVRCALGKLTYFNDPGVYFIVLTFPDLEAPYAATVDFREDDFIPKMTGTQAASSGAEPANSATVPRVPISGTRVIVSEYAVARARSPK